MEDQSSLLQSTMQEDSFEVVMRGYNKRQVDDYVLQCQHHIRDLAQRLALAEQEIERVRAEAATAIEKVASKPVHEEISDRLSQILRLANEEAERERASAADEIASLRAAALADTQNLRDLAKRETEESRRQALAETDALRRKVDAEVEALRAKVKAETDALRDKVRDETDSLLRQAETDASDERERAQFEADRLRSDAKSSAEREVAEARARARDLEESARTKADQLVRGAQDRADALLGEAERQANQINTVLGGRLELLTTTHRDVVSRMLDLRDVLVDVLGREEAEGAFEVPPPAPETMDVSRSPMPSLGDPFVQTAGEVAAAYEASTQRSTDSNSWRSSVSAGVDSGRTQMIALEGSAMPTPAGESVGRVDLGSVTEKSRS